MYEVFINYRTGDGDEAAAMLDTALSNRFGKDKIFRAAKSIIPGEPYPPTLINAVRRCVVLLAVMSADWPRYPQLREETDWVRREILEAYAYGARVIPVLKGRSTGRLNPGDLPAELERLANAQSLRLDTRDNGTDLARIGDELADLIPSLKQADSARKSPAPDTAHNSASEVRGTVIQSRDITGDVGTVIKGTHGPIHAGKGDINQNSPRISGDGAVYVQGDNHGGVSHRFDRLSGEEDKN